MKVVASHLTGNANVRAAVKGFMDAEILEAYYTAVGVLPGSTLDRIGGIGPFGELRRRSYDSSYKPYLKTWPWFELGRTLSVKAGLKGLMKHESSVFNINAVSFNFDKHVSAQLRKYKQSGLSAVYAYEDTALDTFKEGEKLGVKRLYDLPIGYWRAARTLLSGEKDRWPEWLPTLIGLKDSDAKLTRKDEELSLANEIFVASSFTANTLQEYSGKLAPVKVIPYGFPDVGEDRNYSASNKNTPIKLLFVGSLSQRKGIANLFAAVNSVGKHVSLTIVGMKAGGECAALDKELAKHKWIPSLPHHEILKLMREHDVLVFPSLFEGFGLVITEAMSQGTPVITTERTIGPDIIQHGKNGWLVKAGSTEALGQTIEQLLQEREAITEAGIAAMETARRRPWSVYSAELADAVKSIL